jgi:lipid-A-disaccharide synthase
MKQDDRPLIFLVAGESSGDRIGARLMAALKAHGGAGFRFAGVGGPLMAAEGLVSRFPIAELAVMGVFEVLPHVPHLLRRIRQVARAARKARPAVVVTIDSPDFNFRVARRLAGTGIPLVHVVAPTVWAYRPGRAKAIAQFLHHLLVLFPFEPPFFEAVGLPCTFIGHPLVEEAPAPPGAGRQLRERLGIAQEVPLIVFLPGSRRSETSRLLPVFAKVAKRLARDLPGVQGILPAVPHLAAEIGAAVAGWAMPIQVLDGEADKRAAFQAGTATLAASGSVTLELALARLPMVVCYRLNPLTAVLARRVIRVPYVTLVNLILGRAVVPEFLLEQCRARAITPALLALLRDPAARAAQLAAFDAVAALLRPAGEAPSTRAANAILKVIAVPA